MRGGRILCERGLEVDTTRSTNAACQCVGPFGLPLHEQVAHTIGTRLLWRTSFKRGRNMVCGCVGLQRLTIVQDSLRPHTNIHAIRQDYRAQGRQHLHYRQQWWHTHRRIKRFLPDRQRVDAKGWTNTSCAGYDLPN